MTSIDTPHTNGATNGAVHDGETAITTSTPSPFDPTIFKAYFLALLPPLLAAAPHELDYLFDDEFNDRVQRFASEGGGAMYVVKKKEESEGMYLTICTNPSIFVDALQTSPTLCTPTPLRII